MANRFPAVPTATPTQEDVNLFCNASKSGDTTKVVEYLDRFGTAIINERDNMQDTALTWAAWTGQKAMVELLLDRGAEIDRKGMTGRTALGWAANGSKREVVELLMDRGASTELRDNDGKSPADLAGNHNMDLANFIRDNGAQKKKIVAEQAAAKKAEEDAAALRAQRFDELKKRKPPKLKF